MPSLPVVPSVLKVTMHTPVTIRPSLQSRFYMKYTGTAPTAAQLNTYAGSVRSNWGLDLAALFSTNTSLTAVNVQDLSSGGAQGVDITAVAGTRAGTEIAVQCAAGINFQIVRRYRGGKPKIFLNAGVDGDKLDVGHWTAAFQSALITGWQNFITAIVGAGWAGAGSITHVNVSYYSGFTTVTRLPFRARNVPNLRANPLVENISLYVSVPQISSQRRRRSGA